MDMGFDLPRAGSESYFEASSAMEIRKRLDRLVIDRLNDGPRTPLIERIQCRYISFVQLEPIHICIFLDSAWGIALGQGNPLLLETVSDQDLARSDAVFLGHARKRLVVGLEISDNWTVRPDDYAILLTVAHDVSLLTPWMQLQWRHD